MSEEEIFDKPNQDPKPKPARKKKELSEAQKAALAKGRAKMAEKRAAAKAGKPVEEFKKDRFGELAYIYGGSFLQDMLKNYGSYEELAPIQELISLSEDAPPVRVPANLQPGQDEKAFLNYLIQRRILRIGDEFILFDPYTNDILLQDYIVQ